MERLVSAILTKNEASRYLPEVLDGCGRFSRIVVLDDGSTDHTESLCRNHPAVIAYRKRDATSAAWGAEAPARAELWNLAAEYGEWCLFTDADQLFVGDP